MSYASLKTTLKLACLFAAVAFVFSFTVDLWIQRRLAFVESALAGALNRPLEIQSAGYNIFQGFTLEDLTVKEVKTVPVPFTIKRVRAMASFEVYPQLKIRIHKVVFEGPRLGLAGQAEELFRAGTLIRKLPVYKTNIGRVALEMRLSSFAVKNGRVSVFADTRGTQVRQEFERIEFSAGERGFRKDRMRVSGRIAGRPQARFFIESELLREGPGTFDSNVRIDLHEFTTAYLAPYLKDRFKLPDKDLSASLKLKIRDGRRIESDGRFDLPSIGFDDRLLRYMAQRSPKFRYFIEGSWNKDHIELTKIHLKGRYMRLTGVGKVGLAEGKESYSVSLTSGEMSLEKFKNVSKDWKLLGGVATVTAQAEGTPTHFEPIVHIALNNASARNEKRGIFLNNAQGGLRLTPSGASLEDMWVFVNDFPVRVNGKIANPPRRAVSLELSTFPGQIPRLKGQNPFNGSVRLRAREKGGLWSGYAAMKLDGLNAEKGRAVAVSFKELSLDKHRSRWLMLRSIEKDGRKLTAPVAAHAVRWALRYDRERLRLDITDAALEKGKLRASAYFDLRDSSWKTRFDIEDARFSQLAKTFFIQHPAEGKLCLRGHVLIPQKGEPSAGIRFSLTDGFIGPGPSLKSWADQTGIEALGSLKFESFSGSVSLKNGLWRMRQLKLVSQEASLWADFQLRERRLNGRFSVRFPTSSIRQGSALFWVLAFVRQQDWVDFDFHVAGDIASPRIEWLTGEFKKKIENRIPAFLRSAFAQQIERRLMPAA